jgi:hypothetical protein
LCFIFDFHPAIINNCVRRIKGIDMQTNKSWEENLNILNEILKDQEFINEIASILEERFKGDKNIGMNALVSYVQFIQTTDDLGGYFAEPNNNENQRRLGTIDVIDNYILPIIEVMDNANRFSDVLDMEKQLYQLNGIIFPLSEETIAIIDKISASDEEFKEGINLFKDKLAEFGNLSRVISREGIPAMEDFINNLSDFDNCLSFQRELASDLINYDSLVYEFFYNRIGLLPRFSQSLDEFKDLAYLFKDLMINLSKKDSLDPKITELLGSGASIVSGENDSTVADVLENYSQFKWFLEFMNDLVSKRLSSAMPSSLVVYFLKDFINNSQGKNFSQLKQEIEENYSKNLLTAIIRKYLRVRIDVKDEDKIYKTADYLTLIDNLVNINNLIRQQLSFHRDFSNNGLFQGIKSAIWLKLFLEIKINYLEDGRFKNIMDNLSNENPITEEDKEFIEDIVKKQISERIEAEDSSKDKISMGGKLLTNISSDFEGSDALIAVSASFGIFGLDRGFFPYRNGLIDYRIPSFQSSENFLLTTFGMKELGLINNVEPTKLFLSFGKRFEDDIKYLGWFLLLQQAPEIYPVANPPQTILGKPILLAAHGRGTLEAKEGERVLPENKYERTDFLFLSYHPLSMYAKHFMNMINYAQESATWLKDNSDLYEEFKHRLQYAFSQISISKEELIEAVKEIYKGEKYTQDRMILLDIYKNLPDTIYLDKVFEAPWFYPQSQGWESEYYGTRYEVEWEKQAPYVVLMEAFKTILGNDLIEEFNRYFNSP